MLHQVYAKAGKVEVAMEMFSDLRQFDEAKTWAEQHAKARGGDTSSVQVQPVQRKPGFALTACGSS
jgi:pentatricopeptide repeat protein